MMRVSAILCCLVLAGGFFWQFPLFHIVPIENLDAAKRESEFNASQFAKALWSERLLPSLDQAADATAVLKALREEPQTARAKFGRTVGLSRTRLIVLRGSGKIVSLEKKGVGIALEPEQSEPDIILLTGLLFGNTVRDATGLIDAGDFSNSQHFNEVSTELNRIVEASVNPTLRDGDAILMRNVQFVGCAELLDDARVDLPLTVIPLDVRVQAKMEKPPLSEGPHVR